jgi:hypothetical protein
MWVRLALAIPVLLAACNRGAELDETTSSSSTMAVGDMTTTQGVATTYGGEAACAATDDCEDGAYCAAPYDPATATRGAAVCVGSCVPRDDLTRWCIDDLACCEGLRCHTVDGFCHPIADDDTSSGVTDTNDDTSTTEDSTTGTDSTSDTTKGTDDATSTGDSTSGDAGSTTDEGGSTSTGRSEGAGD